MFSVIFDMDGTLLDTQKICVPAWEYGGLLQGINGMGNHVVNVCGTNHEGSNKYLKDNFPELDIEKFRADCLDYINENMIVRFKSGASVKCGNTSEAERKITALKAAIDTMVAENGTVPTTGSFDISDPQQIVYSIE